MASSYSPRWKRLLYRIPHLTVKCPQGNHHWFWDRLCFCGGCQHSGDWHGGIFDMKLKVEYQKCPQCNPLTPYVKQHVHDGIPPAADTRTAATCTLCAKVDSPGFYTGCLLNDGHDPGNKWSCDGNGNLTLKLEQCLHDELCGCLFHTKECGEAKTPHVWNGMKVDMQPQPLRPDVNAAVGKDLLQPLRPTHPDRTYGTH